MVIDNNINDIDVLRRKGQHAIYRGFPITRKAAKQFHVCVEFDSQQEAQKWIDWGVGYYSFLKKPNGLKQGKPERPK